MRTKPTILQLNGLQVEVFKTKIKIHDSQSDVSEDEAEKIVEYLYREGFITAKSIVCELIRRDKWKIKTIVIKVCTVCSMLK